MFEPVLDDLIVTLPELLVIAIFAPAVNVASVKFVPLPIKSWPFVGTVAA